MSLEVVVVGCGVSGLSCGVRLLKSGYAVTIVARDLPPDTTSDVAAAVWFPYKAYPEARVLGWGRVTLDEFYQLTAVPEAGVSLVELVELLERPAPEPWWKEAVRCFRPAHSEELPAGYQAGHVVEVPLIETSRYLRYLLARFQELGGRIEQRALSSLAESLRVVLRHATHSGVTLGFEPEPGMFIDTLKSFHRLLQ
ncbi:MAG: FAD-dependent oxidoreductase, partial [Chloroflexi bacterium]|nr:FAD-dependent oxidoreductase [Chloroflexota bacterium]